MNTHNNAQNKRKRFSFENDFTSQNLTHTKITKKAVTLTNENSTFAFFVPVVKDNNILPNESSEILYEEQKNTIFNIPYVDVDNDISSVCLDYGNHEELPEDLSVYVEKKKQNFRIFEV